MNRKGKRQQNRTWEVATPLPVGFGSFNGRWGGIGESVTLFVIGIFAIIALSFWLSFSAFGGWF